MTRVLLPFLLALALPLAGCHRHPATPEDCRYILARIVELELHELGFRDPVLARRKVAAVQSALSGELAHCTGVPVRQGAMACVQRARSVEELSHRCLR
jgi:hypothetical protein